MRSYMIIWNTLLQCCYVTSCMQSCKCSVNRTSPPHYLMCFNTVWCLIIQNTFVFVCIYCQVRCGFHWSPQLYDSWWSHSAEPWILCDTQRQQYSGATWQSPGKNCVSVSYVHMWICVIYIWSKCAIGSCYFSISVIPEGTFWTGLTRQW